MTPKQRAQLSADAMWSNDNASVWLGIQINTVDEGYAVLTLVVQKHHTNGLGLCHGGVTFSLADSAFAFAANSRNQNTVAQHNSISYLTPAYLGDTLTATACEVTLRGKSGVYDVQVTTQSGNIIAEFRGNSRAIPGQLFDE